MTFRSDFNQAARASVTRKERSAIREVVSTIVFYALCVFLCLGFLADWRVT